jgi:hypothetical protein
MSARFEVQRALALEDRGLFALAGTVTDGTARVGMTASLEGAGESFTRPVHGVEVLEDEEVDSSSPLTCLTFHCRDAERLASWMGLDWEGKTLDLSW